MAKHLLAHITQHGTDLYYKPLSILLTLYAIGRHLSKSKATMESLPEPAQIFPTMKSIADIGSTISVPIVKALSSEVHALLHRAFHGGLSSSMGSLINEIEKMASSGDPSIRMNAVLNMGYIFKHFEVEIIKPYLRNLEAILSKVLREGTSMGKFYSLFAMLLIAKYQGREFM